MGEKEVIQNTKRPSTLNTLVKDLKNIGIEEGMVLLVHSSLSSIGWVCSSAITVILSLEKILGSNGTLVMPSHSGDLSDPSRWEHPPVPDDWFAIIKDSMLAFDPVNTPTRGLGIIPEVFRKCRGVKRSLHPQVSFAAKGKHADEITRDHSLSFGLGMESPLGRIYSLDGHVLLLGVGHDSNTSLHLAEFMSDYPRKKTYMNSAPVIRDGKRMWVEFEDIDDDVDDFLEVGNAFNQHKDGIINTAKIGLATSYLFRQRELVDFAADWFKKNRKFL